MKIHAINSFVGVMFTTTWDERPFIITKEIKPDIFEVKFIGEEYNGYNIFDKEDIKRKIKLGSWIKYENTAES